MKKIIATFIFCLVFLCSFAQTKVLSSRVYDGITYQPLGGVSIYNMNTHKFAFSEKDGRFSIAVSMNDTLVFSKSVYRQLVICVDKKVFNGYEDFLLYYKATMLKEVHIFAINSSYEGFKKDIVNLKLPEYYKSAEVKLSEFEKANATYNNNGGNVLSLAGSALTSPISFLYDKYSHKGKMNRLYSEMLANEDEINRIQDKYNREIVGNLTGLSGDELLDFMMYCRFSYYDLVRMSDEEIRLQILSKFHNYQADKINIEYERIKDK